LTGKLILVPIDKKSGIGLERKTGFCIDRKSCIGIDRKDGIGIDRKSSITSYSFKNSCLKFTYLGANLCPFHIYHYESNINILL